MYQYIITKGQSINIETPFCKNFADVQQETISKSVDCVHMRSTYPNGFIVETITLTDRIIIETNRELLNNGEGHFTVLDE